MVKAKNIIIALYASHLAVAKKFCEVSIHQVKLEDGLDNAPFDLSVQIWSADIEPSDTLQRYHSTPTVKNTTNAEWNPAQKYEWEVEPHSKNPYFHFIIRDGNSTPKVGFFATGSFYYNSVKRDTPEAHELTNPFETPSVGNWFSWALTVQGQIYLTGSCRDDCVPVEEDPSAESFRSRSGASGYASRSGSFSDDNPRSEFENPEDIDEYKEYLNRMFLLKTFCSAFVLGVLLAMMVACLCFHTVMKPKMGERFSGTTFNISDDGRTKLMASNTAAME